MCIISYTLKWVDPETGSPHWEDGWKTCETLEEAKEAYNTLLKRDDLYSATISKPIISTDY